MDFLNTISKALPQIGKAISGFAQNSVQTLENPIRDIVSGQAGNNYLAGTPLASSTNQQNVKSNISSMKASNNPWLSGFGYNPSEIRQYTSSVNNPSFSQRLGTLWNDAVLPATNVVGITGALRNVGTQGIKGLVGNETGSLGNNINVVNNPIVSKSETEYDSIANEIMSRISNPNASFSDLSTRASTAFNNAMAGIPKDAAGVPMQQYLTPKLANLNVIGPMLRYADYGGVNILKNYLVTHGL